MRRTAALLATDGEAFGVVAHDIGFDAATDDTSAGTVAVHDVNEGSITHTLRIDDVDQFELVVTSSGDDDEGTAELEPGTCTLDCDDPGHRAAGVQARSRRAE